MRSDLLVESSVMRTRNDPVILVVFVLASLLRPSQAAAAPLAAPVAPSEQSLLIPTGETRIKPERLVLLRLGRIQLLAQSEEGGRLVTAEADGRVCGWEASRMAPTRCVDGGRANQVTALALSAAGEWAAIGRPDGSIELHALFSREAIAPCRLPGLPAPIAYARAPMAIRFLPGSRGLLSLGSKQGTGRVWRDVLLDDRCTSPDTHAQPSRLELKGLLPDLFSAAAISSDGKFVAAAVPMIGKSSLAVWETSTGNLRWGPTTTGALVSSLALSADGNRLAAGLGNGRTLLYTRDAAQPQELRAPTERPIATVAFSVDGRWLAGGSEDGAVMVWNDLGRLHWQSIKHQTSITALAFEPFSDVLTIASEDVGVTRWSVVNRQPVGTDLRGNAEWIRSLAFSSDGHWLATVSDDRMIRSWTRQREGQPSWGLSGVCLSQEGVPRQVVFHPQDPDVLAVAGESRTIRLLRLPGCTEERKLSGSDSSWHTRVAFSSDGRWVAAASQQGSVDVWDAATGRLHSTIAAHRDEVLAIAFVPGDRTRLVSSAYDGTLRVWDVHTGQPLPGAAPSERAAGLVSALAISSDGKLLATAGAETALWDLDSFRRIAVLGTVDSAGGLLFGPGDRTLVQGDRQGALHLWDVQTQQPLPSVPALRSDGADAVQALAIDAKSGQIAIAALGRILLRSGLPTGQLDAMLFQAGTEWGLWTQLQGQGTVFRHDLGGLLWRSSLDGAVVAQEPQQDGGDMVALKLQLSVVDSDDGQGYTLRTRLSNDGSIALWVNWQVRSAASPLHTGLALVQPPPELRIERGTHGFVRDIPLTRNSRSVRPWESEEVCVSVAAWNGRMARDCRAIPLASRRDRYVAYGSLLGLLLAVGAALVWLRWRLRGADLVAWRFAGRLHATLEQPARIQSRTLALFRLHLPPLPLFVPDDCLLLVCAAARSTLQADWARCTANALGQPRFVFVLDRTAHPQMPSELRRVLHEQHPGTIFVMLHNVDASSEPEQAEAALREAIIQQCEVDQILPYRDGGNGISDEEESFFFGRQRELEQLLDRHRHNFLLVGPRQMGKSSLLNALSRSLRRRQPQVQVLKYQFWNGSLQTISKSDPSLRADTPEAFYRSVMERSQAHQVFLLDEVDDFIRQERQTQYAFCNVMRALSGQERASFVLAGHQELHDAMRTPDHPLRNFGDLLRLEPLDADSACRMVVEPLTALGLHFVDPAAALDWLLRQTACRPHLLAQVCAALVRWKRPLNTQPISAADLAATALSPSLLHDAFGDWDATEGNALLNGTVLRAALLLGPTTLHDLETYLHAQGAHLTAAEIERSVSQLYSRHYALVSDPAGTLSCPLPMFEYYLTNPQPDGARGGRWGSAEERLRDQLARDIAAVQRWRGEARV